MYTNFHAFRKAFLDEKLWYGSYFCNEHKFQMLADTWCDTCNMYRGPLVMTTVFVP